MVTAPAPLIEATLKENAWGEPMCGFPSRLKRMRSIALASVAVPTVERTSAPIRSWSTMIAVVSPSRTSTSGRSSVGMNPCTKALYVSLISRCDSAAIVSNTRELLPEPETPVNTVSRRFGSSTLTSLRLFSRAPWTRIRSWLSATCIVLASALLDADQVARGIADGAIPDPVRLVGRLLDDLRGVAGLHALEGAVEVGGGQVHAGVGALGHHLGDEAALVVGHAGGGFRRIQDDGGVGLVGGTHRDPVQALVFDVVADLEAERVPVEGHGGLGVVLGEEARVNGDFHGGQVRPGSARALLDS